MDKIQQLSTMHFIYICIVFVHLLAPIAYASDVKPVIYPIPLQNETFIPEEYKRLPLVGKCCPINEALIKDANGNSVCISSNDSMANFLPSFSDFNRTGVLVPGDAHNKFVAIIGNPCQHRKYILYPEEISDDEYHLLMNGSIFAPYHAPAILTHSEDYCMEVVPEMGLRVLVCFPEENLITNGGNSRITLYACGLFISVPFLIFTIVAYMITPKLRDVYGKALCHYCGCLALAFITLAIAQLTAAQLPMEICISIAFVIQFSFVACFFWLNVMCIETWLLIRHHVNHHVNHHAHRRIQSKTLFFYYSIWAWGPSAILILVSMAMDLSPTIPTTYVKPAFGSESCWFKSDEEAMPYFYVPVGLLLLGNIILFVMTSVKISRYQQELVLRRMPRNHHFERDQRLFRRLKRTFFVCLVLFFLMGLNWSMELISWWVGGDPLTWSAFDLVNALQGVLIFGLFVLRRPARDFIWHRIRKLLGIHAMISEPDNGSMDFTLLPMINGGSLPRQTVLH